MNKNNTDLSRSLFEDIEKTVEYIRSLGIEACPETALIFGSGLGAMAGGLKIDYALPYGDIPGFVSTTLEFHNGRLLFGKIGDVSVVAMDGRFHMYEGFSMQQITFPVRVMKGLGAEKLLLSNISGGLNPQFRAGDVVVMVDHINLMGDNPLIGSNDERLGPRFPDMANPYNRHLIELAEKHAMLKNIRLARGVYLALPGPSFETPAEYRMLRLMGADMVGMSSVPEVITAIHAGMKVLGLSLISDECFPECLEPLDINLLLERARRGSEIMGAIIQGMLEDADYSKVR